MLIVGMHRSGTSALGGVLNFLGVPAPEEQVTADHHNVRGYFEPQRIVDFHERLFARLGSPSNDPLPLDYAWLKSPVGEAAAEELSALLDDEFGGAPMRLFKDPRMCRLLPVWLRALEIAERPAVAILPCRHPLEVAGSLAAKAGLSRPYSLFMWLQHVVFGERFSRGMPRSFTLYDDLMEDWRSLVAKLERDLAIAWPRDLMRAGPDIDAFLTGELRHHSAETVLDERDPLQALCARAWEACKRLRDDANDAAAMAALDAVGQAMVDSAGLFGPLVVSYQREVERLLGAHDEIRVRDRIIAEQVEAIQERDAGILSRDAAIVARDAEILSRDATILEQIARIQEIDKALTVVRARVAQRDQELRWANEGVHHRDRQIRERDELVRDLEKKRRDWEQAASEATVALWAAQADEAATRRTLWATEAATAEAIRAADAAHAAMAEMAARLHALETSTTWKATHAVRRIAERAPFARILARRGARLAWWIATGKLFSKLEARKALLSRPPEPVAAPRSEPVPDEPVLQSAIEPEVEVAVDAVVETEAAVSVEEPAARPKAGLRIAFLSGEADTPGHKYRVARPAEAARALGATTSITRLDQAHAELDAFRQADLIYIWRAAWDEVNIAPVMAIAEARGIPVVFDIDDLIVDPDLVDGDLIDGVRSQNHDPEMIRDYFGRLQRTLVAADFGCAPTPALVEQLKRWSKRVHDKVAFRIANGFDEQGYLRSRLAARARRAEPADGLVRIGYAAGSKTHQADFAQVVPAVARILREHREARLTVFISKWGPTLDVAEFAELDGLADQIEWRQYVPIEDLPNELARFDINLAPLEAGNIFCEAKSELKYFEAALVDVPTIASPTEPYRMAIRDGETGFLAQTPDDWYAALKRLMVEPGLRRAIAGAALIDSIVRYGPERRAEMVDALLEQTLERGRRGARSFALDIARQADAPARTPFTPAHETLFERDLLLGSRVTVVIPLYNYAHHVIEALESIAAQSVGPIDLVVVDDCSTDDSVAVAQGWMEANAYRFGRTLLLRNLSNSGLAFTRNVGFTNADSPFVLPLDADNRLAPNAVERLLERLQASAAAFAYPLIREFGDAETAEGRPPLGVTPFDPARFVGANFIDAMALVRRSAWARVGGYDHIRFGWEDYDFWCKLVEQGMYGEQVDEVLAEYRVHQTSMLRSQTDLDNNKRKLIADIQRRHPWLRVAEADRLPPLPPSGPAPAQTPAPAEVAADPAAHPRSEAEQAARLERFLPHLRCPQTGAPLRLEGDTLVGGGKAWPIAHGRPVLFADLGEPRLMPGGHISNELPERALEMIEATNGLVLNLSAGGSARSFDHVIEAEFAVFRHTDVLADAHALPFADDTFELVVSMNAFEHYHSPRQAADEIMRVLKPGGRVLVRTAFLQPLHEAPWHFYNTTRYGLERWFERFDAEDLQVSDNFNPIHSLAWFMSDAEALLRKELSDADAERFRSARASDFVGLWRDPASRDSALWKSFFDLPRSAQEGLAAGFEYLGRKPS